MKAGARQYDKELNYQEACNESYVAFAQARLPGQVQDLIDSLEVLPFSTAFAVLFCCAVLCNTNQYILEYCCVGLLQVHTFYRNVHHWLDDIDVNCSLLI